jgi:glutamate/tyrosine decarboxylase-like PLP-dependent enzyme
MSSDPFADALPALEAAWRLSAEYVAGLGSRRVARPIDPDELASALDEPLPEQGCDPAEAVRDWWRRAEHAVVASSGPRFFGYVIGGGTPAALAGDWLAATIDQDAGLWSAAPASVQTEAVVIRWLKELFGLPSEWAGTPATGATHANLIGLAAGRQWAGLQRGFDPGRDGLGGHPPIPVVSSTEAHSSIRRVLATLGLGRESIQTVPSTAAKVDLQALEAELARIDGPAIVVANAGDVNTGAFDPLNEVAAICRAHPGGVWLHVDGAFGLFAAVSPRTSHLVRGIELVDSVTVDAHKWLNVPYDSGFAFVRDAAMLTGTFATAAAYLTPGAVADPADYVPELSRRFRGLPAWCALKAYGRQGYRELVERCLDNAAMLGAWIAGRKDMQLLAPVNLNIVCFRFAPEGWDEGACGDLNRRAVTAIQEDGRAFVSGTTWNDHAAIRAAFDNWATSEGDVQILTEALADTGRQLIYGK